MRDGTQHVTVTVVIYNTVAGGVPSVEDVKTAVADMEELYAACGWTGKLASDAAGFMKSELTVDSVATIAAKVATQPYVPENAALSAVMSSLPPSAHEPAELVCRHVCA